MPRSRLRIVRGRERARTFARLAEGEGKTEADLLSYLLFDGGFTRQLIDLGWRDAERQHDEIVEFFDALLDGRAPKVTPTATVRKALP